MTTTPSITPPYTSATEPRVDFTVQDYERIIYQKGRRVLVEKSLVCPCKSTSNNHLLSCKNCGGTGWIFYNPVEDRLLVQGLAVVNDYKPWSEESRGTVNITAPDRLGLTYMDRITLLDSIALHQEVLHLRWDNTRGRWFAFTPYLINRVEYAGLYVGSNERLLSILDKVHISNNQDYIYIDSQDLDPITLKLGAGEEDRPSLAVRYRYRPQFFIIEIRRESMQTLTLDQTTGTEYLQNLPSSFVARRSHYIMGRSQIDTPLLDNSIIESCYDSPTC